MRTRSYVIWALVASVVAGCGDNGPSANLAVEVTNSPWMMEVGDSVRLEAVAREWDDMAGAPVGPPVTGVEFTWRSLFPSVMSIDATGMAVARAKGVAELQVCVSGTSCMGFSWRLAVINPVAGVTVTPDTISVLPYGRHAFEAVPFDAAGAPVIEPDAEFWWVVVDSTTWTVADQSVAVMGAQAPEDYVLPSTVTGLSEGTTRVTATFRGGTGTATVEVMLVDFQTVAAGGSYSCALTADNRPYCWGSVPIPGPQAWLTPYFVPRMLDTSLTFVSLSLGGPGTYPAGGDHSCGMTADGTAYCWGSNASGQLGQGTLQYYEQPVRVGQYARIAVGGSHTCALTPTDDLHCWGSNAKGQLGFTSSETCGGGGGKYSVPAYPCTSAPTVVEGRPPFVDVSTGLSHTCALADDGSVYCWGAIGSHSSADTLRVPGGHVFVAITSGSSNACGLDADGAVYCWGNGSLGHDDVTTSSDEPLAVAGNLTFLSIDGSRDSYGGSTCGVTADHAIYCWGFAAAGFAGPTPTRVGGDVAFATVSAGSRHACGMGLDGLAYCWGESYGGVLGVPDTTGVLLTPRPVVGQQ